MINEKGDFSSKYELIFFIYLSVCGLFQKLAKNTKMVIFKISTMEGKPFR